MEPISRIDSSINQLFFRGVNVTYLARTSDFESVLYLLVNGALPNANQRDDLAHRMMELRGLYKEDFQSLDELVQNLDRMKSEYELSLFDTLLTFVTLCPLVIANQFAVSQGRKAEDPDNELGHAANFLWMVHAIKPMQTDVIDFQTSLILPMDDPDNPSLTALCQVLDEGGVSDALHAALQKHVGPLHHGAGTEAIAMFENIQKPANARDNLKKRLESGGKIYGLGHRIYRGLDPRAQVLHVSDAVAKEGKLLLSEYKGIEAFPNIDLYNAAVNLSFGFPAELNTSLFAVSRSAGWMAHILERFP
ncbi:MAG: citrate/2-methylcitrate synthase [Candidatus Thorarchaeota archaeon]